MASGAWFRPPRPLLVAFLAFALAPIAALGWLGWRLLEVKEFALDSRISPDGRQVVYNWYNSDGSYDLRLVGIDGSGSRVLYADREMEYVIPAAWAPDGRHVLVTSFGKDLINRIGLVSVADGSVRVLKTLGSRGPRGFCFSPDGRHVAYDAPPRRVSRTATST